MGWKQSIRGLLNGVGIEVVRRGPQRLEIAWHPPGRTSGPRRETLRGALERLAANGFCPETVIDVGAADGTPELYESFPQAHHLLVEPLHEFAAALNRIAAGLERADVFRGAAGASSGSVTLNVHPDLVGSSILREIEDSGVNGFERRVQQATLDELSMHHGLAGPFLVKIDTQGAELEVLRGAEAEVLGETEAVVVEVSFFGFFVDGPLFLDVCDYLRRHELVPYDIVDARYRPLDGALSQVDVVFVREDSTLRRDHSYATQEQRQQQDDRFRRQRS